MGRFWQAIRAPEFLTKFPWRRAARVSAKLTGAGIAGAGLGVIGLTGYAVHEINRSRVRYMSDLFTMTPEALRMPFHSCSFVTEDGVSLSGWFIPQTVGGKPSKKIVVCCNPYNHDRSAMLGIARGLWEASYSVFLFNFRSHSSTPTRQTVGHLERMDARAAINWVKTSKYVEGARIALVGASMGGAVALMMAQEVEDIVCVGSDCAFSTLYDVVAHLLIGKAPVLESWPRVKHGIMTSICAANKLIYGYDLREVGPAADGGKALEKLKCPLLLVHSEKDSVVPVASALKIFNGASTPSDQKEVLVLPDVEHVASYFRDESKYLKHFVRFLDKAFDSQEKAQSAAVKGRK